jgi:hypothetical protein
LYTLRCTKKLLDRIRLPVESAVPSSTTVLGNWYATALFWIPQVALLVNEQTLLPILMPLAPASTLLTRVPSQLALILEWHRAHRSFIAREVAAMREVSVAKTADRSVVGTMNEFAFLAEAYREHMDSGVLPALSMRLADTPCGAIRHNSPARLIREFIV